MMICLCNDNKQNEQQRIEEPFIRRNTFVGEAHLKHGQCSAAMVGALEHSPDQRAH